MNDTYSSNGLLQVHLSHGGAIHPFELQNAVVAFYDGGRAAHQANSSGLACLLNKLIASFCGTMTHVELAFRFVNRELGREAWFACSVYQGHPLQFRSKQYDTLWEVIDLKLSGQEQERLFRACRADAELALSFDGWFFLHFMTPHCSLKTNPEQLSRSTWCSEHVAARLASFQFDLGRPASRVTPGQIYTYLTSNNYSAFRRSKTVAV